MVSRVLLSLTYEISLSNFSAWEGAAEGGRLRCERRSRGAIVIEV